MKNDSKKTYWVVKALISFFMLFTAFFSYSHPEYLRFPGFPDYFRIELVITKVTGAILLLIPRMPLRVKEWIYAGFGIVIISAPIAHIYSQDDLYKIIVVIIEFTLILLVITDVSSRDYSGLADKGSNSIIPVAVR
jgi:hypothetical protein